MDKLSGIAADGSENFPGWSLPALQYIYEERNAAANGHETLDTDASAEVRTLSSNTPITLTGITCLAHVAAHCNKGSRSNIASICTESNCFNNIG